MNNPETSKPPVPPKVEGDSHDWFAVPESDTKLPTLGVAELAHIVSNTNEGEEADDDTNNRAGFGEEEGGGEEGEITVPENTDDEDVPKDEIDAILSDSNKTRTLPTKE